MTDADSRTSAFLWALAQAREVEPLLVLLLEMFKAFDEKPARMFVSAGGVKQTAYNEARLAKAMRSPDTISISVKGAGDARVHVGFDLRDDPQYETHFLDRFVRCSELVAPVTGPDDERVERFLARTCAAYPVSHGGVFRAASSTHASAEANLVGNSDLDPEVSKRIGFDAMNRTAAITKLRRLYPMTIVGPAIWAALPPLPAVEPPLVVRDLGGCKMITAWPTLVDPHDPQFLLGTRALRQWLWPHTIQNPADDPAAVDTRLRWLDLLPW